MKKKNLKKQIKELKLQLKETYCLEQGLDDARNGRTITFDLDEEIKEMCNTDINFAFEYVKAANKDYAALSRECDMLKERIRFLDTLIQGPLTTERVISISKKDEHSQLAEATILQEEANHNNNLFNEGKIK